MNDSKCVFLKSYISNILSHGLFKLPFQWVYKWIYSMMILFSFQSGVTFAPGLKFSRILTTIGLFLKFDGAWIETHFTTHCSILSSISKRVPAIFVLGILYENGILFSPKCHWPLMLSVCLIKNHRIFLKTPKCAQV